MSEKTATPEPTIDPSVRKVASMLVKPSPGPATAAPTCQCERYGNLEHIHDRHGTVGTLVYFNAGRKLTTFVNLGLELAVERLTSAHHRSLARTRCCRHVCCRAPHTPTDQSAVVERARFRNEETQGRDAPHNERRRVVARQI
jgi:hypothetical protein